MKNNEVNTFKEIHCDINAWLENHCDDDDHAIEGGKSIPYIGWYWRDVDFESGNVPIGDCGTFIGFMENNKYDYPERLLTPAEFEVILGKISAAMINPDRKWEEMKSLWIYMQTLSFNDI